MTAEPAKPSSALDIFADPPARAESPQATPTASNPFDPLSPASKPVESAPKPSNGLDLMSQIADWGAKNHEEENTNDDARAPQNEGAKEKDKVNPNVMCVRQDAVDLSDEVIEGILQKEEKTP